MAHLIDASGVALDPARAPKRIVSLVPSTTELLCHLGLADALVGVTVYCVEPRDVVRVKTKIGGEKNPDLGKIAALEPDLVIANIEENQREHVDALRVRGIPVWVVYPRTVEAAIQMIRDLGEVTGAGVRAAQVADELESLRMRVSADVARQPPAAVFYPIWRGPYMTINGDTYVHDVLRTCGGVNVFADRAERYPTVTLEEVAARRPDVIILPDEPFRFRRVHVGDFAPFGDIPAVREARIHLMDGKLASWHGPRLAEALRTFPSLFARVSSAPRGS